MEELHRQSIEFQPIKLAALQEPRNKCPVSNKPGKAVQIQTVKAQLKVSLRLVRETEYFFCVDKDCPVVYFSADGVQTFTVDDLREPVYQKGPETPEVLVCYCFRHTVGSITKATTEQRQAILADIKEGTQADQCACDLRNPQGNCCLGNVSKLIKPLRTD
jgi:hypothetical protein